MSDEAINALFHLALERCGEDKEALGTRLRRAMKLKADAPISKRLVRETMSPDAYKTVYAWYETLYLQLQRTTEVPNGAVTEASAIPQPAPAPTDEGTTADPPSPAGSSSADASAPGETAVDTAYHKLYQEALGWGIAASEIEHVLKHHDLAKSRTLLWQARRQAPAATPIEAAAD
jgi:hypothetical protein